MSLVRTLQAVEPPSLSSSLGITSWFVIDAQARSLAEECVFLSDSSLPVWLDSLEVVETITPSGDDCGNIFAYHFLRIWYGTVHSQVWAD